MNNFYITVSNGLLETKHYEAMGEAVWLYMWFLDKMTVIRADRGVVLGGKPITHADVEPALNLSRRTYVRYLARLKAAHYVEVKKTPRGVIVEVMKAKKSFGRSAKYGAAEKSVAPDVAQPLRHKRRSSRTKVAQHMTKNGAANKTVSVDNNSKTRTERQYSAKAESPDKPAKKEKPPKKEKKPNPNTPPSKELHEIIFFFTDTLKTKLNTVADDPNLGKSAVFFWRKVRRLVRAKGQDPGQYVEAAKMLILMALTDDFHKKNATSLEYIDRHASRIIESYKNTHGEKTAKAKQFKNLK